jgi:serine/threonine protein kinase
VTTSSTSWIGLRVGDFVIQSLMTEGAFSWIFKAQHQDSDQYCVCKIAKPETAPAQGNQLEGSANAVWTGFVQPVKPDPVEILRLQADFLKRHKSRGLVELLDTVADEKTYCLQLPYYQVPTLSQIDKGAVSTAFLARLAHLLHTLKSNDLSFSHGDLKPANVLVAENPILIDPGYFGPMQCSTGKIARGVITTPLYYPKLEPDDLFAFAIMLWQIAAGYHPLQSTPTSNIAVGEDVEAWIRQYETVGNFFLRPLRFLQRPTHSAPAVTLQLESFLLKGLGLAVDRAGRLSRQQGFASFLEFGQALMTLEAGGIVRL